MKPIKLKLQGFTGIKSATGKDVLEIDMSTLLSDDDLIVAIIGPNGAGKTTLVDNLHPYRLMPSRASSYSPNAFSYWDHVFGLEAQKELVWESSDGVTYRSTLIFRNSGKTKKSEAYLHQMDGDRWAAVSIPDGTVSDGKTDTYDRCIESLLGAPEMFFTSAFTSQNKRPLSSYTNGEIKELMADLLGIEKLREIGKSAAAVVKGLNAKLSNVRSGLLQSSSLDATIKSIQERIAQAGLSLEENKRLREACQAESDAQAAEVATAEARLQSCDALLKRKSSLLADLKMVDDECATRILAIDADISRENGRQIKASKDMEQAKQHFATLEKNVQSQLDRANSMLDRKSLILNAVSQAPGLSEEAERVAKAIELANVDLKLLADARSDVARLTAVLEGHEREGTNASQVVDSLRNRVIMLQQVPCNGHAMQSTCPLMQDALAANQLLPEKESGVSELRKQYSLCRANLNSALAKVQELAPAETRMQVLLSDQLAISSRVKANDAYLAMQDQLQQAELTIAENNRQLMHAQEQLNVQLANAFAELDASKSVLTELHQRKQALLQECSNRKAMIQTEINGITIDDAESVLIAAKGRLAEIRERLSALESSIANSITAIARLEGERDYAANQVAEALPLKQKEEALVSEIAYYTLLQKAFGNDGIVALSIDDAGPTLAGITNDLLLTCYGPRFTVSIETQEQKANGDMKEGFDVVVHDGERDESKSIAVMSGGERVWINECLIRAIAIYQAQNGGGQFSTLFSDESDGPLDAQRKKQFMKMKREVLRIGGYQREFFISQTPELWELADKVVDVTAL